MVCEHEQAHIPTDANTTTSRLVVEKDGVDKMEHIIKIFRDDFTYEEWCEFLGLDPNDEDNQVSWSEIKNNQQ